MGVNLYTIGFTGRTAKDFFTNIQNANVKKVIDVRLNNTSQLSGFAKRDDLSYFLKEICGCDYVHNTSFAPTIEILNSYKKKHISWNEYETQFLKLISIRKIENMITENEIHMSCLLCSELQADRCHRTIIAKYFQDKFKNVKIYNI